MALIKVRKVVSHPCRSEPLIMTFLILGSVASRLSTSPDAGCLLPILQTPDIAACRIFGDSWLKSILFCACIFSHNHCADITGETLSGNLAITSLFINILSLFKIKTEKPLAHLNKGPFNVFRYGNSCQALNSCKESFTGAISYLLGFIHSLHLISCYR